MPDKINTEIEMADAILPQNLMVIPIQTTPVFPGMMAPLILTKPKLVETVKTAIRNRGVIGLVLTKDPEADKQEIYDVGTAVRVIKKLNTTDGATTVLVQSLKRFEIKKVIREEPFKIVTVEYKKDIVEKSKELDALTRSVISQVKELSEFNPFFTDELKMAMINAPSPGALADIVAFALSLKREDAQKYLETYDVKIRFEALLYFLKRERELANIQKKINEDVSNKLHKMQKEYYLKEQLKSIKRELGHDGEEGKSTEDIYREKIEKVKLSKEAKKVALEELGRMEATSESSPEYNVIRTYLDWILALPWGTFSKDSLDLKKARKVLNADHYGIPKVKDRILEFLAVKKLNKESKGSILCLVGPPGVGKTSLGKSIAKAMNRKFFRFSLGGMRDEAEIKGHRRTYIGAMPGKLLNAMKRAETQNPVLMLDEVDKLGASFHGDPASALLEVLDPEQNNTFIDHYLDVAFDLSNVTFILTANTTETIPAPLLDRMEVIELDGYTLEEKEEIAVRHVIPEALKKNGLRPSQVGLPKETLHKIMTDYCREPGMRSAQQKIGAVCRKIAAKIVENPKLRRITVKPKDLYDYLGPEIFENEQLRRTDDAGVVIGMAWTAFGGDILFIESRDVPRKIRLKRRQKKKSEEDDSEDSFGHFKITGQLGDVMNESSSIAYSYVKKATKNSKKAQKFFEENDIHLHIPAGAVPKDGPSAGVTMATSLLSLVTGKKVKPKIAMTGELSLVGKVLPVGGIREKVLAAKRAGIKTIVLPKENKKDLKEIPKKNLRGLNFVFADRVEDVFKATLQ